MPYAPLMLAGLATAAGLLLLLREWIPSQPDLGEASKRLAPSNLQLTRAQRPGLTTTSGWFERAALALHRRTPHIPGVTPDQTDLNLLGVSTAGLMTRKLLGALVGLALPVLATMTLQLAGVGVNLVIPAGVGLFFAVLGWLLPDSQLREKAGERREEFVRAALAYLQLVAIMRMANAGPHQAMMRSAEISDAWTFRRIRLELARAEWTKTPAWDALSALGEQIDVPQLADIGDIMRTAGETSAGVSDTLLARATALRDQLLSQAHAKANSATTSMAAPGALLLVVALLAIVYPVSLILLG